MNFNWKFLPGCDTLESDRIFGVAYRIFANGDEGALVRNQHGQTTELCKRPVDWCMQAAEVDYQDIFKND